MQTAQCDYTAVSNSEIFYADSFIGATTYRFKFENSGLMYSYIFDRPIRSFALNLVSGLQTGTSYSVQVSIEINGVFGPYGKVCTLTTQGGIGKSAPKQTLNDTSKSAINFNAVAYPNPFAENFKLDVQTNYTNDLQIRVYDMLGNLIDRKQVKTSDLETLTVGNDYASGVYNIIVIQGEDIQVLRVIKQ